MGKVIFFLFSDGPNGPICSRCLLQHFPFHLVAKPAANSNLRPTLGSNPFRGILELHQIIEFTKKWVGNHSTLDINQNKHEQKICHYIYIYLYQSNSNHVRRLFPLNSCSFQLLPISNIHLAHSFGCPSSFNQKLKAKEDTGQTIQASMRTILGLRPIISWSCWRDRSCLV